MARVEFAAPLKNFTDNLERCEVSGKTAGDAMREIADRFPGMRDKLLKEDGTLRAYFIVLVDGRDIRMLEREQTPVRADSVIRIVPAIAGG